MKTINRSVIFLLTLAISFVSCDDFLDHSPNDRVALDNFYQSSADLKTATAPLYNKVWFDFNDKFYFGLGDGRSNNLFAPYSSYIYPFTTLTETALTDPLVAAWGSFYNVIGQSNNTINNIRDRSINVSEAQKNAAIAEARFMRGTAYWYIGSLWGNAIIIEDNSKLVVNPIVNTNPRSDVFEFAMRDLEFAAKYLPETSDKGRLTKWSALGMLSRVYLSVSGISTDPNSGVRDAEYLEKARKAAEKVCKESGLGLMGSYDDLFKIENNNNPESLFALQWIVNGEWGVNNSHQAYFAISSDITKDDAAWGGSTFASYDVLNTYHPRDMIRRKATFMADGDFYAEIDKINGGYTVSNVSRAHVKKGVVGSAADNDGNVSRMNSALNTYMLRLAEVYLIYAEATLGNQASTTNADALEYFNMVRERADMPKLDVITFNDIFYERRIELAMEGQFWYDMVRYAYYKQQWVLNYIDNQSRTQFYDYNKDTHTLTKTGDDTRPVDAATAARLLLPYPEVEVSKNKLLKEPPVPYVFSDEKITDLFD